MASSLQVPRSKILYTFLIPPQITLHARLCFNHTSIVRWGETADKINYTTGKTSLQFCNREMSMTFWIWHAKRIPLHFIKYPPHRKTFEISIAHLTAFHVQRYLLPSCMGPVHCIYELELHGDVTADRQAPKLNSPHKLQRTTPMPHFRQHAWTNFGNLKLGRTDIHDLPIMRFND
jgi:hypothetical protein